MSFGKTTMHVVETAKLEDFSKDLLNDLANYQRNTDSCPIIPSDIEKAIKIIRKRVYGVVTICGKCDKFPSKTLLVQIFFIHRKGVIAMKVYLKITIGWNEGSRVISHTRKKITAKKIVPDLLLSLREVLDLMIGKERVLKLKKYLQYREKREKLLKAAKCEIDVDVDELKEVLKSEQEEEKIEFIDFDEPFLLIGTPKKHILITPFGKYEVSMEIYHARQAFREFVKAKRVPYGKDAMKKIEALLIQASI